MKNGLLSDNVRNLNVEIVFETRRLLTNINKFPS